MHAVLFPARAHRQRILAYRNRHAQRRAKIQRDGLDRVEQRRILMPMASRGHPVGRELDAGNLAGIGRRQIGQRFAYRHAPGRRTVEQSQRRALAERKTLAMQRVITCRRHRHIGHRRLPRPDHLVARGQPAHRAVAYGDQKTLRCHRRQTQHAPRRLTQVNHRQIERRHPHGLAHGIAVHARRLAEQYFHRHIHRLIAEMRIAQREPAIIGGHAQHGERATLALAQGAELVQPRGGKRQHITFLRLVAPDFTRTHARRFARYGAQVKRRTAPGIMRQFGHRIRQATRTHIVYRQDRIRFAQLPAAVDDFLRTPLHFRIATLHRSEVEIGRIAARRHR